MTSIGVRSDLAKGMHCVELPRGDWWEWLRLPPPLSPLPTQKIVDHMAPSATTEPNAAAEAEDAAPPASSADGPEPPAPAGRDLPEAPEGPDVVVFFFLLFPFSLWSVVSSSESSLEDPDDVS